MNVISVIHLDINTAIKEGNVTRLDQLLSELDNKNPNVFKSTGKIHTALDRAAYYGQVKIIKFLKEKGVSISQYNDGLSPMHSAAISNQINVISLDKSTFNCLPYIYARCNFIG